MSNCIFCKIVNGEIDSEILHESEQFIVIKDIEPKAPVHLLLIPKKHIESLNDVKESDITLLGEMHYEAKRLASEFNVAESGYKIVTNTGNDGGQVVPHLHMHLLGGEKLSGAV